MVRKGDGEVGIDIKHNFAYANGPLCSPESGTSLSRFRQQRPPGPAAVKGLSNGWRKEPLKLTRNAWEWWLGRTGRPAVKGMWGVVGWFQDSGCRSSFG